MFEASTTAISVPEFVNRSISTTVWVRSGEVLILGGGDGLAAREVLKYPHVQQVTLVDLDPAMTGLFSRSAPLLALNGGSLRNPASFCGVTGLRPSPGLVPQHPVDWVWDTISVSGPIARTVEDVALMLGERSGEAIAKLKALAADIARNLMAPIEEMGLSVTVETRTGDTSTAKRKQQRPPTPETLPDR